MKSTATAAAKLIEEWQAEYRRTTGAKDPLAVTYGQGWFTVLGFRKYRASAVQSAIDSLKTRPTVNTIK